MRTNDQYKEGGGDGVNSNCLLVCQILDLAGRVESSNYNTPKELKKKPNIFKS